MNRTSIEWAKNPDGSQGYTLNSKSGCDNHTPEGLCLGGLFPCYACKLARGRLKPLYLANGCCAPHPSPTSYELFKDPFYPRFWRDRLKKAYQTLKSSGIFLDDMSDWMLDCWPREWTEAELQMVKNNPWHRFYTLTKQPQNLIKFSPFPENCWVGVTATNQEMLIDALTSLAQVKASIKYISFEPLLEAMNGGECEGKRLDGLNEAGIKWLIIGACTGTYREMKELYWRTDIPFRNLMQWAKKWTLQPKIEWVQEIVEAADRAGIPVFLKDSLKPLLYSECGVYSHPWAFRNWELRQEMPG